MARQRQSILEAEEEKRAAEAQAALDVLKQQKRESMDPEAKKKIAEAQQALDAALKEFDDAKLKAAAVAEEAALKRKEQQREQAEKASGFELGAGKVSGTFSGSQAMAFGYASPVVSLLTKIERNSRRWVVIGDETSTQLKRLNMELSP